MSGEEKGNEALARRTAAGAATTQADLGGFSHGQHAPRGHLRIVLLASLVAVPMAWSASLGGDTRTEIINQVLGSLFLGSLPLLGAMLLWDEDFEGADLEVRYGKSRRVFAARALARTVATLTLASLAAAALTLLIFRGTGDPLLTQDLLATLPVALASGVSLGCFLAAFRVWLAKWGLVGALVVSWLLGSADWVVSIVAPAGHVRFLLGLGTDLPLPAWGSFVVLYAAAGLLSGLVFLKIPD